VCRYIAEVAQTLARKRAHYWHSAAQYKLKHAAHHAHSSDLVSQFYSRVKLLGSNKKLYLDRKATATALDMLLVILAACENSLRAEAKMSNG
jgi:hypothetical protein